MESTTLGLAIGSMNLAGADEEELVVILNLAAETAGQKHSTVHHRR